MATEQYYCFGAQPWILLSKSAITMDDFFLHCLINIPMCTFNLVNASRIITHFQALSLRQASPIESVLFLFSNIFILFYKIKTISRKNIVRQFLQRNFIHCHWRNTKAERNEIVKVETLESRYIICFTDRVASHIILIYNYCKHYSCSLKMIAVQ